jgi:TolB protein
VFRGSASGPGYGARAGARRGAALTTVAAALLSALAWPAESTAAFPGSNGKIAFSSNRDGDFEIWTMEPDGSDPEPLTANVARDSEPTWSADGSRIAFVSERDGDSEIYVMNADGSDETRLSNNGAVDRYPAWSPDGSRIAFVSTRDGDSEIFVMNADGSNQTRLTNNDFVDVSPAWSPDGAKIAFERQGVGNGIHVMDPDGSDEAPIGPTPIFGDYLDWAPDGTKIAFSNSFDILTVTASGTTVVNLTNDGPPTFQRFPAWAPDQSRIAFERGGDILTMAPGGGGETNLTPGAFVDWEPDWQPVVDSPVIFIHGFSGSPIFCGASEVWPNLPFPNLSRIALGPDGRTTPRCPDAGPREGQILETVLGSDVYGSTVEFLRDEFGDVNLYAWDWRKSPEEALAGLDALVDRVRAGLDPSDPGGGKVILMAHSMGGLVTRLYLNNPARAAKVSRVLTVGTPYWGTPKGLFPFVYGVESPGPSFLDVAIGNGELRAFARFMQGLFFGWPSDRYGGWLSIEGREPAPLERSGLLRLIDERGGNPSLYATALAAHNLRIDEFATGGTDYQTIIGTGIHTVESVGIERAPLLIRAADPLGIDRRDIVHIDWGNGDGTVPLRSAIGSTPRPRRHFACGIDHVPLPGDSKVTSRIGGFLNSGVAIPDNLGPASRLCEPTGFALSVFPLSDGVFARSPTTVRIARGGGSGAGQLSLKEAEERGLISAIDMGDQIEAATSSDAPIELKLKAEGGAAIEIAPLVNGRRGEVSRYVADGDGKLTIGLGKRAAVEQGGRAVRATNRDNKPPRTRTRVRTRKGAATLTFRVSDPSPTTTFLKSGKEIRTVEGRRVRIPTERLRRGVKVLSIDAFGNAEKPKRVRRR